MSTEHQQYSTENQSDKIYEYANKRGIEIIRTYADEGKSGLRIEGRLGLQELIRVVESGQADFQIILVIILLTIAITLIDKRIRDNHTQHVTVLDEERINLALSISSFLFDHQRVTQVSMNQSLAKALRDLSNSTESLDKSSKELGKTVKAIPSNREILTEIKAIKSRNRFDSI
jgi:hypothetical protein